MFLFNNHLGFLSIAEILVVPVHLYALALDLFGYLLVNFELAVGLLLGITALSHEHFPAADVVHSFILVRE